LENRPVKLQRLLFLFLVSFATIGGAWATTVLPLTLDDIVSGATVAFEGTCTENHTEHDGQTNLDVTFTTFAVHDVIKGDPGATYTIKQIGGEVPGRELAFNVRGIPRFTPGEEYVVFLPPASSAGFASPVGLSQGRFTIEREVAAKKVANGRDFREMTADIPDTELSDDVAQHVKGASAPIHNMDIEEFKQLARNRARKQR